MITNLKFDYTDEQRRQIAWFLDQRYGKGNTRGRALATREQIQQFVTTAVGFQWNSVFDCIDFNASDAVKRNLKENDNKEENND